MENTTDAVEVIRRMRTFLPLSEAFVAEVAAMAGRDTLATRETVPLLLRHLGHPGDVTTPAQADAADRATAAFAQMVRSPNFAVLVCMARAALAFGPQYVVHSLHPTATRTVLETDLAFWPTTTPRALMRPLLVRATPGKGTGCLFRDVTTLLYLPDSSGVALTLSQRQGGTFLASEVPLSWTTEDDRRSVDEILSTGLYGQLTGDGDRVRVAQVLRWIVTFGLFMEAESQASGRGVAEVRAEAGTPPDGRPPKKGQGYTIRHVRISDAALAAPPRKTSDVTREAPPHPDGMRAEEVAVRGFLRRQVCGKGNADRKVIFVAPFTRTQWVSAEREVRVR